MAETWESKIELDNSQIINEIQWNARQDRT